jgi:Family of unknown function (DUF695)
VMLNMAFVAVVIGLSKHAQRYDGFRALGLNCTLMKAQIVTPAAASFVNQTSHRTRRALRVRTELENMRLKLISGIALFAVCAVTQAQTWSTATATRPADGRVIVYRYVEHLPPYFDRTSQPDRVMLTWRYTGQKGMPAVVERRRMDAFGDALEAAIGNASTSAVVLTGDNVHVWLYYTHSADMFKQRIAKLLVKKPRVPVTIESALDPSWTVYEQFLLSVKRR